MLMKDINEQQLGNKVRIDRNGNAHTGASDIRKRVKVWWDAARIRENMNKGMSREEAGENIPDFPITYEEAEKKALDYLEQVLKRNKSYQIRVSCFMDEAGDFGEYCHRSPFYIVVDNKKYSIG